MNVIAQIIGAVGLLCAVLSFQQRTHRLIVVFQILSCSAFCVHFTLLGAYTGAILNLIGVLRSIVFVNKGKRWADSKIWLVVFCGMSIAVGVATWNNIFSALPIAGMICTTVAFWVKTPKYVRLIAFPSSPLWLIYNLINNSYAGVITEVVNMCSIITAMIRLDYRKTK